MFDEVNSDVRQVVLQSRSAEVASFEAVIASRPCRDGAGRYRCDLCPFRSFAVARTLRRHVRLRHTRALSFVASGTKKLAVIWSLVDERQIAGEPFGRLLQRSAELMATTISPRSRARLR